MASGLLPATASAQEGPPSGASVRIAPSEDFLSSLEEFTYVLCPEGQTEDCPTITQGGFPRPVFENVAPGRYVLSVAEKTGWIVTRFTCSGQNFDPNDVADLPNRRVTFDVPVTGQISCAPRFHASRITFALGTSPTLGDDIEATFSSTICRPDTECETHEFALGQPLAGARTEYVGSPSGHHSIDLDLPAPWSNSQVQCSRTDAAGETIDADVEIDLDAATVDFDFVAGESMFCRLFLHAPGVTLHFAHGPAFCFFCGATFTVCVDDVCNDTRLAVEQGESAGPEGTTPESLSLIGPDTGTISLTQQPEPRVDLINIGCRVRDQFGEPVADPETAFTIDLAHNRVEIEYVSGEWARCNFKVETHDFVDTVPPVAQAAEWAYAHHYVEGFPGDRFRPQLALTRGQGARLLWRVEGEPPGGDGCAGLSDVPAWARPSVCWLVGSGHATGFGDGTFRPDLALTRGQFARMVWRLEGSPAPTGDCAGITDLPAWAHDAACWLVDEGHVTGTGTQYRPNAPAARGHAVRVLHSLHA